MLVASLSLYTAWKNPSTAEPWLLLQPFVVCQLPLQPSHPDISPWEKKVRNEGAGAAALLMVVAVLYTARKNPSTAEPWLLLQPFVVYQLLLQPSHPDVPPQEEKVRNKGAGAAALLMVVAILYATRMYRRRRIHRPDVPTVAELMLWSRST